MFHSFHYDIETKWTGISACGPENRREMFTVCMWKMRLFPRPEHEKMAENAQTALQGL